MFKKNIYKWHRTVSLLIAIPVILWAASGFMHPIMTTIRPKVATQYLTPIIIDSSKILIGLDSALTKNNIDSFTNFRLVHIDINYFYQIQRHNSTPIYLSTKNGKFLPNGDWLYAQYLAKQFLEGQSDINAQKPIKLAQTIGSTESHDCCDAATSAIINNTKGSKATSAVLITAYNNEYKSINRLLPVYKVAFDRNDGIRIYVETTSNRFAFAMDNKRYIFDRIFTIIHTWGWLDFLGKGKFAIEFILATLAFLTTIMGLYIFFSTKSKKINGNIKIKARRNHRFTSLAISLFTLMFTFSGAYHALAKFKTDTRNDYFIENNYAAAQLHFNYAKLQSLAKSQIINVAIAKINDSIYWQINTKEFGKKEVFARKDLMKDKLSPLPSTVYINITNNTILQNGDVKYANYLAPKFSKNTEQNIVTTVPINQFTNEYNFTDKRLPVFKVSYASNNNERFYVETSTGKLSKAINDKDLIEGYSFAFFHKHEFMAWGGKSVKDFSTMFWAMAQIAMVTIGLILFFKTRRKRTMEK